jgi:hypothetical protein
MTQYVGCDHARTLLDGLIDGELSMADQLAVESHLRWCDTCALRVTDMRVIGASLRAQATVRPLADADDHTLTALTEGLLVRVRAERDQSLPSRFREMVADRRLLWPAVGATSAVLLCVIASMSVLHASVYRDPMSLAGMISALASPGTIQRPLRPADNGVSIPRLGDDQVDGTGEMMELMAEDDVVMAVRTVIGRDGIPAHPELLQSDDDLAVGGRDAIARAAAQEMAVLDAVRKTKFVPAHTPLGYPVAVDVVWVLAKMTVAAPPQALRSRPAERSREVAKPAPAEPAAPPLSSQPLAPRPSATA